MEQPGLLDLGDVVEETKIKRAGKAGETMISFSV
jgi:hypothetical protein